VNDHGAAEILAAATMVGAVIGLLAYWAALKVADIVDSWRAKRYARAQRQAGRNTQEASCRRG